MNIALTIEWNNMMVIGIVICMLSITLSFSIVAFCLLKMEHALRTKGIKISILKTFMLFPFVVLREYNSNIESNSSLSNIMKRALWLIPIGVILGLLMMVISKSL